MKRHFCARLFRAQLLRAQLLRAQLLRAQLPCLLLSALLALTLPVSALDWEKVRGYQGFEDIPSTESTYFGPVKTCYEAGLLNGSTETSFGVRDSLSAAQLTVICARLYNLRTGGKGEIPALPTGAMMKTSCLRFYDEDGTLLKSYCPGDTVTFNALGGSLFLSLSETPEDPALPETCTLEVGLEGYGNPRRYQGIRESYQPLPGVMTEGFNGTGYRILSDEAAVSALFLLGAEEDAGEAVKNAWWYPAAFYLASEGQIPFSGLSSRVRPAESENLLSAFGAPASRALFAWMVDAVAGELPVLNETAGVPDVTEETADAEAILRLYQAGVLTGVDEAGTFMGSAPLTRGQAAILLDRVLNPDARIGAA
ncbi:S-layer homology domain-containing protein [uncultured Oscillibacter sp.]|uniref:S-layer homology domain-containing protein n=1 Tax=uncultured Oscillibacter sp. TaxID=876091 RepID=UPI00261CA8B8|nr:S-layer homology domain-containing protein [uncultured Oscillibacter sp.]